MGAFIDLTGKPFGNWTALYRGENKGTITRWMCRCTCGTERLVQSGHLLRGASTNCGCVHPPKTHGHATNGFTKKYSTWRQVKARCCNPKHKNADIYHGLLCDAWLTYEGFNRDVTEPPTEKHSIDRIDNSKGYEPGNVRWVLMAEQHRNQTNCRWIEFNGKCQLLTDWAKELGIADSTLHQRIKKWGIEQALTR